MPGIVTTHCTNFVAAERADNVTDAPLNSSSSVSVEDFDYDDRFTPVALRLMPRGQGDDADPEALTDT